MNARFVWLRTLAVSLCLVARIAPAAAGDSRAALPAMDFTSSIANEELFRLIKASATFPQLERDLVGSPIVLRVVYTLQPAAGDKAAGLLAAIWAGGLPGLIPAITNDSFSVTYEVRVHGKLVASYSYRQSFGRAINLWAKDDQTYGLGRDGFAWLKSTAIQFTAAAARDPRLADLRREYHRYFGDAAP